MGSKVGTMGLYIRELIRSWREGRRYRKALEAGAESLRHSLPGRYTVWTQSIDGRRVFRTQVEARDHDEAFKKAQPELMRQHDEYRDEGGL